MLASHRHGFTLIEISIVLVIIGLIVGGILVGRDLIKAAEIRATISQLEKYKTATLAFGNKYNGLPGDFPYGGRFGFAATNQDSMVRGWGDGNGLMQSSCGVIDGGGGENFLFWTHLSQANLIGDATTSITDYDSCATMDVNDMVMPLAKISRGNRFAITSFGGRNYFMISAITVSSGIDGYTATTNLSPQDALYLDSKVDDANPTTGTVTSIRGAAPGFLNGGANNPVPGDCYDFDATPPTYATASSSVANAMACELQLSAGF